MATIQEQLQRKRFPIDTWDIKEKLLLASAVVRSGDQNWMSVSRLMKTLGHTTRPSDWYSQKNCAAQYGLLLENVETPKRKKRTNSSETVMETPSESILRKLREERMIELKRIMNEERKLYMKLKEEIIMVKSGYADEAQLREMCLQIDQENKQKDKDAQIYAEWLKQREEKKLELERQWRPPNKIFVQAGQKRKVSDTSFDNLLDATKVEQQELEEGVREINKPGMSPLLTSLLKSPPVPNQTSILHSAITNQTIQRGTSPTIASLLNSSPEVNVSPGLQQLVSTAIGQQPAIHSKTIQMANMQTQSVIQVFESGFLPANLGGNNVPGLNLLGNDLKKDPLQRNLILTSDNIDDEMDLIEEVIKNVEENESKELFERKEDKTLHEIDQNKIGEIKNELDKTLGTDDCAPLPQPPPQAQPTEIVTQPAIEVPPKIETPEQGKEENEEPKPPTPTESKEPEEATIPIETSSSEVPEEPESKNDTPSEEPSSPPESIVNKLREVSVVLEEIDHSYQSSTQETKTEEKIIEDDNEDSSTKDSDQKTDDKEETATESSEVEVASQESRSDDTNEETKEDISDKSVDVKIKEEIKEEIIEEETTDLPQSKIDEEAQRPTFTDDSDFDESTTPFVKTEKVKRDYSRNKKKEDKEMHFLLGEDKLELTNDDDKDLKDFIDSLESEKKDLKSKAKGSDVERSESPWTEEESELALSSRTKRRYSTPATPSDSVPNSPASSLAGFEDDREYRAWKKSVMLVYNRLATHKYASLFLRPITDDQAPGYHNIIHEPKDLQTLRRNIDSGQIKTTQEFIRYVLLMFQNAIMFNKTNNYVYNMAREMQNESVEQIQILVQAQTQIETPARRETRTSEPGVKHKPELSTTKSRKRKAD